MKSFAYTITDPLGIHARPAGLLAKAAKAYSDTTVTGRSVNAPVRILKNQMSREYLKQERAGAAGRSWKSSRWAPCAGRSSTAT